MDSQKPLNPNAPEFHPRTASSSTSCAVSTTDAVTTAPPPFPPWTPAFLPSLPQSIFASSMPYPSYSFPSRASFHSSFQYCSQTYPKRATCSTTYSSYINNDNPLPVSYSNPPPIWQPPLLRQQPLLRQSPPLNDLSGGSVLESSADNRNQLAQSREDKGIMGAGTDQRPCRPRRDFPRRQLMNKAAGRRGRRGGNYSSNYCKPEREAAGRLLSTRKIDLMRNCRDYYMSRRSASQLKATKDVVIVTESGGVAGGDSGGCGGQKKKYFGKHNPVLEGGMETSVMIRNIPNQYTREMFMEFLDKFCYRVNEEEKSHGGSDPIAAFDFIYLPIDFSTDQNKGFAFVNFTNSIAVWKLHLANLEDQSWERYNSHRKKRDICVADVQGTQALLKLVLKTSFPPHNPDYLPVCFNPPRNGYNNTPYQVMTRVHVASSRSSSPYPLHEVNGKRYGWNKRSSTKMDISSCSDKEMASESDSAGVAWCGGVAHEVIS